MLGAACCSDRSYAAVPGFLAKLQVENATQADLKTSARLSATHDVHV